MKRLSKSEEELMNFLWQQKTASLKELLEAYPDPKPAMTTVATLLKRMTDKGFIDFVTQGKSRIYRALVKKEAYFGNHLKGLIKNFFNNSNQQFASFFTTEVDFTEDELKELRNVINDQIKQRKK